MSAKYMDSSSLANLCKTLFGFGFGLDVVLTKELDQLIGPDPELTACVGAIGHPIAACGKTPSARRSPIGCAADDGATKGVEQLQI
jgi:hypothetical protein